jgi:hypothetical protein
MVVRSLTQSCFHGLQWRSFTVQGIHCLVFRPLLSCGGECTGCRTHFSFFLVCKTWGRVFSMLSRIRFPKESGLLGVFSSCVFTSQRRVVCSSMSHHIHTILSCFSKILRIQIFGYPHENWYTERHKNLIS